MNCFINKTLSYNGHPFIPSPVIKRAIIEGTLSISIYLEGQFGFQLFFWINIGLGQRIGNISLKKTRQICLYSLHHTQEAFGSYDPVLYSCPINEYKPEIRPFIDPNILEWVHTLFATFQIWDRIRWGNSICIDSWCAKCVCVFKCVFVSVCHLFLLYFSYPISIQFFFSILIINIIVVTIIIIFVIIIIIILNITKKVAGSKPWDATLCHHWLVYVCE